MKKAIPELLAPAGNFDGLKMAVQYGADAVYLGAKEFSARKSAGNFDMQELARAFDYCHERGVKAYLTLNTLIKDEEFLHAYETGCEAAQLGADALIMQDAGLIDAFIRYSDIPIHISTQASLCSLYDILALEQLPNIRRVVLARETPLENIRHIKEKCSKELEIFVHGALCVSFSGQCLLSSMAGGRSGNRGACAQPCRREYSLYKNGEAVKSGYLLSARDLCTIEYLPKLIEAGADSLKIEGRLKRPEYVGVTVSQYRKALDCIRDNADFDSAEAKKELCEIFNRGGFVKGYYLSRDNIIFSQQPNNTGVLIGKSLSHDGRKIYFSDKIRQGDSIELRKNGKSLGGGKVYSLIQNGRKINECEGEAQINSLNVKGGMDALVYKTGSIEQLDNIKQGLRHERVKRPLKMVLYQEGNKLCLTAQCEKNSFTARIECQAGKGALPDTGAIETALRKLGSTPFEACEIIIKLCGNVFFTLSDINRLRRESIEGLLDNMRRSARSRYSFATPQEPERYNSVEGSYTPMNIAEVYDSESLGTALSSEKFQAVYFRPASWECFSDDALKNLLKKYQSISPDKKVYFAGLAGCLEQDYAILERNIDYMRAFDGILAESPAFIYLARKYGLNFIAGPSLNILNSYSAAFYMRRGAERICLSYELDKGHIKALAEKFPAEIRLEGRSPVMLLMHCPRKAAGEKCSGCEGEYILTDKQGRSFPLVKYKYAFCRHVLYNCKVTSLLDKRSELEQMGLKAFSFAQWDAYDKEDVTRGHYLRGIE